MIIQAYEDLKNFYPHLTEEELKDKLLNWLASSFKVQPTFVGPWLPISFLNKYENVFEWSKQNTEQFLDEISFLFDFPALNKNEIENYIHSISSVKNAHIPEPVLFYVTHASHWFLHLYYNKMDKKQHILYIIETDDIAYKISFLTNALYNHHAYVLYYPSKTPEVEQSIEYIEPYDKIWTYSNLWLPKKSKLKTNQQTIINRAKKSKNLYETSIK
ncbi:MAG: hypothetical protein N2043_01905 [Ignavibacterium sp.]|nr:hypothetical protein [Ignavibacterium sp.]